MKFKNIEKYTYVEEKHKKYLQELSEYVGESNYLPKFHIYPKSGLANDPNGLAYYNGAYHVFYQWFPFEPTHGMKHWGHYTSDNLMAWKDEGLALIPDKEYEKHGCYSGNAIEKDGKLYMFYTANYKTDDGRIPKQALAIMDQSGKIQKYSKNPVVDGAPEGMTGDIRDPFVFEKENHYYMLLGAKSKKESGALLIYSSENLLNWSYLGEIQIPIDTGYMIECPSYIKVNGKDVLIFSPMGLEKEPLKYQNQFSTLYLIGELDIKNLKFNVEFYDEVDSGFDFYAPQAFYGKNHEPMMMAWFGCGEQDLPSDCEMWKHGLTMPYTLSIKENRLTHFVPQSIKESFKEQENFNSSKCVLYSNCYHVQFDLGKDDKNTWVRFGQEDDYWELAIDKQTIQLDRSHLKTTIDKTNGEKRLTSSLGKQEYKVDVYVDNSFVEIFLDEGVKSFAFRCYNLSSKEHYMMFEDTNVGMVAYYK